METLPQALQEADMIYSFEYDVTDIDTPILIEPPKTSTAP